MSKHLIHDPDLLIARTSSYDQYCDLTRQYDPNPSPATLPDGTVVPPYKGPSVKTFIEEFQRYDLLKYSEYITQVE